MAKNPNEAEVSTKLTAPTLNEADSNTALCQDLERTLTTTNAGHATGAQSSSVTLQSSLKLNTKAAAASLTTTSAASESQAADGGISPKMRKLDSPLEDIDLNCLLLADSTLECAPLHLRQLLQHFNPNTITQAELLMLLIYCVALETGFATQAESVQCADIITRLSPISSYHSKNLLHLTSLTPSYISDTKKTHLVMQLHNLVHVKKPAKPALFNALLTCLLTGDFLIVTLTPVRSRSLPGRSLCLSIGRYVLSTQPKNKPLHQRFRKLGELSNMLRQNLFVPVRNRQLDALEINVYPSLLGLPAELYESIFQHLGKNQMKIVANVCKHLNYFSTNSKFML